MSGGTVTDTAYGQIATNAVQVSQVAIAHEPKQGTEAAVREYFKDIPVMIQIARCESRFRHTLADGSVLRGEVDSRDIGVMQVNSFYHGATAAALGLDLNILTDNMAYARHLYMKEGTKPWNASASCWSNALAKL